MMYQLLVAGLLLTSCTPQEAIVVEEVVHEGMEIEQTIQEAIKKPRAPPKEKRKKDDRTAPVEMKKERHDDVTRPRM